MLGWRARTAQTAKVRSLLGPLSGASHSRVPRLLIPRKGKGERILPPKLLQPWKWSPKAVPSPRGHSPSVAPYWAPQGPSHCPQGLTTSLAGRTAT